MFSAVIKNISSKIISYGLPVFYFLIAVSFYLGSYDSAQIKITVFQTGGIFLICLWFINKLETCDIYNLKKNFVLILPILLFLISGLVSYIFSPYKLASANELTKRIIYCFLSVIIMDCFCDKKNLLRLVNILIFTAYIVCFYAIIQFIDTRFFPAPPAEGLDPFIWRWAFDNRIFSTFGNPNFFGDFLVVASPIVLALFFKKKQIHLLFLWLLICFSTIFSYSKGAWLGFGTGIISFAFLFTGFILKTEKKKKIILIAAMSAVTLMLVAGGIFFQLKSRPDSSSFRIFTWLSCWEMINTHPVLGTGIGTFYLTYPSYRRPQIFFIEGLHNTESDHPENEYLEVFYDEGFIGLGIFLLLLITFLTVGLKNLSYFKEKFSNENTLAYLQLGFITALISQIVHNCVCVSLRFVSSGVMLWLLIGCIGATAILEDWKIGELEDWTVGRLEAWKKTRRVLQILIIAAAMYCINIFIGYFQADVLHAKAIQYSKAKDWTNAIELYSKVIEKNKSFIMARYFRANNYNDRWQNDDPEKALDEYKEIWKLAPNYVQSKFLTGVLYSKLVKYFNNKLTQALEEKNEELAKKYSQDRESCLRLAVKYFKEYKITDPIFAQTYYSLADLYTVSGNYNLAEKELLDHLNFPNSLSEKPHNFYVENWKLRRLDEYTTTCLKLGSLEYILDRKDNSEKMFLEALKYDPQNSDALKSLLTIYSERNDKEHCNEVAEYSREHGIVLE